MSAHRLVGHLQRVGAAHALAHERIATVATDAGTAVRQEQDSAPPTVASSDTTPDREDSPHEPGP